MRDFKGMKRQRGRNRKPGGNGANTANPNRSWDSQGPENIKVRGNAQTVYERYMQLARDAAASGDRVLAENYGQHAEHYFRVLRALQPARPVSEIAQRELAGQGFDIDFEDESGAQAAAILAAQQAEQDRLLRQQQITETGEGGERRERPERSERQNGREDGEPRAPESRSQESRSQEPRSEGEPREGGRRESRRERWERRREERSRRPMDGEVAEGDQTIDAGEGGDEGAETGLPDFLTRPTAAETVSPPVEVEAGTASAETGSAETAGAEAEAAPAPRKRSPRRKAAEA